ncbi:MAG TPA: phosphoribosyl-AMP cyclohydrolase [Rhodospirillaceae bacterium]|jgi:phosphoribosyl-AMP cyclohydrolase|nr:phosphoribosyl-AMP cyclohydrolase [Alphaproteobacteria bacterium]HBH25963.1 phosphoribosyl-AMP cyclohydrolase [Rhodospirillaceae bacterium]
MAQSVEETTAFAPRFGADGLMPAVAVDAGTGRVLMLAYMNAQALALTQETGFAHYWSRSRGRMWKKGESSGAVQKVIEIRVDCDQDTLVLLVDQAPGGACHTGRDTCFYRRLGPDGTLGFDE